jgi:uridine kinase
MPRFVAIVGGSGSGKSWLAERLQVLLGKKAARLSLDDFYRDRSHLPMKRRCQINFDHPRSIDWSELERVLSGCNAGMPVAVPEYDFKLHIRSRMVAPWLPKPIVLVDGLWLLQRPAVRRLFWLSIFVDCPEPLRLRRRLKRDVAERGRSAELVEEQFRRTVAPMHERHVAPQARWADVIVRSPVKSIELQRLASRLDSLNLKTPTV